MGTNYFLVTDSCPCCGSGKDYHIGKFSYGWEFHFQAHNESGFQVSCVEDWLKLTEKNIIKDEDGKIITYDDFWKIVDGSAGKTNHVDYC